MLNAPLPADEARRLQEVQRFRILDTPPQAAFDRLTRLAARIFDVPIAVIDLLDEDRQWFKSHHGTDVRESSRDIAFCAHAILANEVMVVPDALQDARFADNPLVTGELALRFYAGAPLRTSGGFNVGAFAIMDRAPRQLSESEIATLSDLAALAVDEMELRLEAAATHEEAGRERREKALALQRSEAHFRSLIENASDIITVIDGGGVTSYQSPSIERVLGFGADELIGHLALEFVHPDDVGLVERALARLVEEPNVPQRAEYRFRHRDGSWRVLESTGKTIPSDWETGNGAGNIVINSRDVTERRQAERSLQRAKDQLQVVLDTVPGAVTSVSSDGKYLGVNRYLTEGFQLSAEAFVGQAVGFTGASPGFDALVRDFFDAPEPQASFEIGLQVLGVTHTMLVTARKYEEGRAAVLVGIDITERKAAEAALQRAHDESELRVRKRTRKLAEVIEELRHQIVERERAERELDRFFSVSIDMLAIAGFDGHFKSLNPAWEATLGHTASELLSVPFIDFVHPDDRAATLVEAANLSAGTNTIGFENRYRCRDGSYVWLRWQVTSVPEQQLMYAVAHDITARRQAEEALRQSEARKAAILTTALDCIISMDHEGKVLDWNPASESTFGYSRAQAMGQQLGELIVPEPLREQHYGGIARYLATGEGPILGNRIEVPAQRADGATILVELYITAIPTQGPPLFTAYLRDITERKQTDEALKAAKEEAERANAAKSEFLSRMSHELRTPMNAILGFAQLLEMDELSAEQHRGVEQILLGGRHLLALINEVLDIARIESEQPLLEIEAVPAASVLASALDLVRPLAAQRDIELRGDWSASDGLCVLADRRRLVQSLLNLLSNAVKYNRAGGIATLSAQPSAEGRLCIAISDSGPGIAPDKMASLFVPFERLGAERGDIEGTGLGLALTRRLVEAMDGVVTVRSTLGEGSTFVVDLPLAQISHDAQDAEPIEREAQGAASFDTSGETRSVVLYIEDNLSNFGLVQDIVRHRPEIKLLAAMRGRIGLELAQRHRPDLILLDVHLPDIDGDEVLRLLRSEPGTRDIPVVVVSADATPRQIERLMQSGARAYLTKPLDIKQFLATLDENLRE